MVIAQSLSRFTQKFSASARSFRTTWNSDRLIAKELVLALQMSTDQIKIHLAEETLRTQFNLAQTVARIINTRVYIYDPNCYFSTQPYDVVLYDNIRTIRKDGHTALLSTAAQSVVSSCEIYRSLLPPAHISEDSRGVYVTP